MKGGADSGFRHVEPTKYEPRLLHCKGNKKKVVVKEVSVVICCNSSNRQVGIPRRMRGSEPGESRLGGGGCISITLVAQWRTICFFHNDQWSDSASCRADKLEMML